MERVSELLKPEAVVLSLEQTEKIAVIRELARPLVEADIIRDEEEFFSAILRRENLESTGIGLGVAIPHARTDAVTATTLAFGRSEAGVDFNSLDGKPCHLVFLIAAPGNRKTEYIMTLARVSKLLRHEDVRAALLAARTVPEVLEAVARNE